MKKLIIGIMLITLVVIPLLASWTFMSAMPGDQSLQLEREHYQTMRERGFDIVEVPGIEAVVSSDMMRSYHSDKVFVHDIYGHSYFYEPIAKRVTHITPCTACSGIQSAMSTHDSHLIQELERQADIQRKRIFDVYGIMLTPRPMKYYKVRGSTVVYSPRESIDLTTIEDIPNADELNQEWEAVRNEIYERYLSSKSDQAIKNDTP